MTEEEKRVAQERDSFMKTCIIAISANYAALNRQVPTDDVVDRSIQLAEKLWSALQKWRQQQ